MGWHNFENCSLQELADNMGVTCESLAKVTIKEVEQIYQNFTTFKDSRLQFKVDKTIYHLEELKKDK